MFHLWLCKPTFATAMWRRGRQLKPKYMIRKRRRWKSSLQRAGSCLARTLNTQHRNKKTLFSCEIFLPNKRQVTRWWYGTRYFIYFLNGFKMFKEETDTGLKRSNTKLWAAILLSKNKHPLVTSPMTKIFIIFFCKYWVFFKLLCYTQVFDSMKNLWGFPRFSVWSEQWDNHFLCFSLEHFSRQPVRKLCKCF